MSILLREFSNVKLTTVADSLRSSAATRPWTVSEINKFLKHLLRLTISVRVSLSRSSPVRSPFFSLLDEAFTSENWIVRIYQVKKEDQLGRDLKHANAFAEGKKGKKSKPPLRRRPIVKA